MDGEGGFFGGGRSLDLPDLFGDGLPGDEMIPVSSGAQEVHRQGDR